jgi:hypothetical protein
MNAHFNCVSRWLMLFAVMSVLCVPQIRAQRIALKTNALELATCSPNIGIMFRTSRHFTFGIDVHGNPMNIDKYKLHFLGIQGESRYWFSRVMARHFVGITGWAESHDLQLNTKCYHGDATALGISYGYAWPLSERWNIETSVAVGMIHYRNLEWNSSEAKPNRDPDKIKTVIAPMMANISFVYIIK